MLQGVFPGHIDGGGARETDAESDRPVQWRRVPPSLQPAHHRGCQESAPHQPAVCFSVDLSRRQLLRNVLADALHRLSGTHYRKLFSVNSDSVAVFKSRLKTFLFSQAFSSSSAH